MKDNCGLSDMPTQMTYHLRSAMWKEGDWASQWADKPHRLVYDASREIERLTVEVQKLQKQVNHLFDPTSEEH